MSEQQKGGGALTFAERYSLVQVFGLTTQDPDTDGAAAGDPTPISPDEAEEIRADLEEVGGNVEKFLKMMGVEKITDIPKVSYPIAVNVLRSYRQAKERKAAAAKEAK